MKFVRGLVLAGFNLAAVLPMIAVIEGRDAELLRQWQESSSASRTQIVRQANFQKPASSAVLQGMAVTFDPCTATVHHPVQVEVVRFGNMPVALLTGWREACRPSWSLSGKLLGTAERPPRNGLDLTEQLRVDLIVAGLIAIQWMLVGAFPLTTGRPWAEPDSWITFCTILAAVLSFYRLTQGAATFPALLAGLAWLWWLGVLIWRGMQLALRSVAKLRPRVAS